MKRKTISVRDLVDAVNKRNSIGLHSPEWRKGHNSLLESILHETNNYEGFNYLRERDVPKGQKPGIIFDDSPAGAHEYPDETRRFYYISSNLRKPGE